MYSWEKKLLEIHLCNQVSTKTDPTLCSLTFFTIKTKQILWNVTIFLFNSIECSHFKMFLSLFLNMVSKSVSPFTSASQLTYSKRRQQATRTTETNLWAKCAVVKLARSFPLTCYPGCGFIWGWFRRWLRSSSRWRRLSVWRTQLCLGEPLHHCAVLGVTVPAAALLLPAVLGHYKVIAAVVAEDATAKPKGWFMYQKNEWGVILLIKHILSLFFFFFFAFAVPAESQPAVMSSQPPGELALAAEAVRGLLIH